MAGEKRFGEAFSQRWETFGRQGKCFGCWRAELWCQMPFCAKCAVSADLPDQASRAKVILQLGPGSRWWPDNVGLVGGRSVANCAVQYGVPLRGYLAFLTG